MITLLSGMLFGQQPVYFELTEDDGLPSNTVYSIIMDEIGHIWMGTDNGIVRYDGTRFKMFRNARQKGTAMHDLQLDDKGRIWCANFTRQIFWVENDSMYILEEWEGKATAALIDIQWNSVTNRLIIGAHHGIFEWTPDSKQLKSLVDGIIASDNHFSLDIADDGRIVAIRGRHLLSIRDDKSIEIHESSKGLSPINRMRGLHHEKDRVFTTFTGISGFYEVLEDTIVPAGFQSNAPIDHNEQLIFYERDEKNQIWLATKSGLYLTSKFTDLTDQRPILEGVSATDFLTDKEGQTWISSLHHGVFIIPSLDVIMNAAAGENITALAANEKSEIFFAKGRSVYSLESGELIFKNQTSSDVLALGIIGDKTIVGSYPMSILPDKVAAPAQYGSIKELSIGDETIGVATNSGAYLGKVVDFLSGETVEELWIGRCYSIYQTAESVYMGFDIGLFQYDRATQKVNSIDTTIYVSDIVSLGEEIYVCTRGSGLFKLESGKLQQLDLPALETAPKVFSQMASRNDTLWAAGESGLLRIVPSQNIVDVIDKADGMPTTEIRELLLRGHRLFAATSRGLISIPVGLSSINTISPKIILRTVNSEKPSVDVVEYSHDENDLEFAFYSPSYRHRGRLKYHYRLVGMDKDWQAAGANSTQIRYSKLPPGEYTFEVKAENEDGVESAEIASYSFLILAPFWQTGWFIFLMILLGLVVLLGIYFWRIRYVKNQNAIALEQSKMKEQLTSYRLQSLRSQMNPHFVFNALNTLQKLILTNEKQAAGEYLGRFSDLMRKFLSMSDQDSITVSDEIEALNLYLEIEKARLNGEFEYQIVATGLDLSNPVMTGQALSLLETEIPTMLIQPLVENAVKHGLLHKVGQKKLEIRFVRNRDELEVVIEDNGVGRKKAAEINEKREGHRSFGLQAIENRIQLLNQKKSGTASIVIEDLYDKTGEPTGTLVKLKLGFVN